MNFNITV